MVSIHHVSAPATRPSESPATTAGGLARVGHLSLFSQSNKIQVPHCEEDMTQRRDNIPGIDDVVAEFALARCTRLRALASRPSSTCGRRFKHLREPTQPDLQIETCACLLPSDHDGGCVCEHGIERRVYRVDSDGREHYATANAR